MKRLGRKRIIYDRAGTEPYMLRYYIFRKPTDRFKQKDTNGKSNLFLHKIMRSDEDDHCHNHPWDSKSFILSGGYFEHEVDGSKHYVGQFQFNDIPHDYCHKLELWDSKPVWSIFWHGPRKQDWGFNVDGNIVNWRRYLGLESF